MAIDIEGSQDSNAAKSWHTWRTFPKGSVKLTPVHFICQNYRPNCWSYWQNLPTSFALGLRNRAGHQVDRAEWTQHQFGVTMTISLPASGEYAFNSRFIGPANPFSTAAPGDTCYEMHYTPYFKVSMTPPPLPVA